jgi:hypothetical protein
MNRDHWNSVYESTEPSQLGWYEPELKHSLRLIDQCDLGANDLITDVGAGTSSLVGSLLERGFRNLVAVDHSATALRLSSERLPSSGDRIRWIEDDLIHSTQLVKLSGVRLWHDRAVLHFMTSLDERNAYHKLLTDVLGAQGYVILATFSMRGVRMCSRLPVVNHDADTLSEFMGSGFELVESFEHEHVTPGGELRPYVYALFRSS